MTNMRCENGLRYFLIQTHTSFEIQSNGFKCSNIPLEIGTRGIVNARNRAVLTKLCHGMKVNKVSCVTKNCSKLALLGSYSIWNARYSTDWSGSGFLKP